MENTKILVKLKDHPNILATASISIESVYFGYVSIKGFCIWKSDNLNVRLQEFINITPPTRPAFGRRIMVTYFEDPKRWEEVEMLIYSEYSRVRGKTEADKVADDINNNLNSNSD